MEELIIEIQKLAGLFKHKLQEVENREKLVSERERIVEERTSTHAEKHQELLTREGAVSSIENVDRMRTENENRAREINESWNSLQEEKKQFKTFCEGERGNMAESKKTLDAGWAELNLARKNMESEVKKQVEDLLSKFKK